MQYVKVLAIVLAGLLVSLGACQNAGNAGGGNADGTVTMSLSNAADAPEGSWFRVFVFESGADPNTQEGIVAVNSVEVSDGAASFELKKPLGGDDWYKPSDETWVARGRQTYDYYIYTAKTLYYDTDSKVTDPYPKSFAVVGDVTQNYDYEEDLVDIPSELLNTLTVTVTGAVTGVEGEEITGFNNVVLVDGDVVAINWVVEEGITDGESSLLLRENVSEEGSPQPGDTWLYEPGKEYMVLFTLFAGNSEGGPSAEGSYSLVTKATFDSGHQTVTIEFDSNDVTPGDFAEKYETEDYEFDTWYGPRPSGDNGGNGLTSE